MTPTRPPRRQQRAAETDAERKARRAAATPSRRAELLGVLAHLPGPDLDPNTLPAALIEPYFQALDVNLSGYDFSPLTGHGPGPNPDPATAAGCLIAGLIGQPWASEEFRPGFGITVQVPGLDLDAPRMFDVLDPLGTNAREFPYGYWNISPEARAAGFTPATAPPEQVTMPGLTADYALDYRGRWLRPYAGQAAALATRAADAERSATLPGLAADEQRRAEGRVESLTSWLGLYARFAPDVLAYLDALAGQIRILAALALNTEGRPATPRQIGGPSWV